MEKPVINYTNRAQTDRINNKAIFVPTIVERGRSISLKTVVEQAIDRGVIVGIKPVAATSIAEGIAEELYHQFGLGHSIQFGKYFYGRLYLDGTVEAADAELGEGNGVNVRLFKGPGFKLKTADFSWHLVDSDEAKEEAPASDGE
jgi:hypothetical protein